MSDSTLSPVFWPVSWDDIHRKGKALALRLHDLGPWKGIVAIARGGLVPATIIARELDIRLVETVCAVAYADDDSNPQLNDAVTILKNAELAGDGEGWLVIDDLVDTGRTFQVLRKTLPKAHYATIYAKPMGLSQVQTYIAEVTQETWIYFPWDIEAQFVKPIAYSRKTDKS